MSFYSVLFWLSSDLKCTVCGCWPISEVASTLYSRYRQRYRIVVVFPLALFVALVLQTFLALFVVLLAFILCAIIFSDCSSMLSRVVKSGSYSLCMKTVHCPPLNLAMMYTITIVQPVCNNDKPKVAQTHVHNNLPTRH